MSKQSWGNQFAHLDPDKPPERPKAASKAKPPTSTANALTKAVIHYLGLKGWKCWRNNNGAVYDPTRQVFRKNPDALLGVPDVLGFCRKTGRLAAVEVKAGKDKLSVHQTQFLEDVRSAGGFACEARDVNGFIEEFEKYLKQDIKEI